MRANFRDRLKKIGLAFVKAAAVLAVSMAAVVSVAEGQLLRPGGSLLSPELFRKSGAAIVPTVATDTIGSSGSRIADIFADNIDATTGSIGSLAIDGAVSGDLEVSGSVDAEGLEIDMPASQAANTTAASISINDTQANSVLGADINIGASGKSTGIRVSGTGSTDTDENDKHLVLWGNTALNQNKVLSVGNGASFTETLYITANGTIKGDVSGVGVKLVGTTLANLTLNSSVGSQLAFSNTSFTLTSAGGTYQGPSNTSGSTTALRIIAGAHTGQTASTEVIDLDLDFDATLTHATGAITEQRSVVFRPRTYAFAGASVITDAATLAIAGAPVAGTNATITNSRALWVQSGVSRLDGNLSMGGDALILRDTNSGITASTTQTQGQGALTAEINEVSTVATTNDTVTLPAAAAGLKIVVINNGAETLQIFPASGDNLGAGVNTAATLNAGSNVEYVSYDGTNWEAI